MAPALVCPVWLFLTKQPERRILLSQVLKVWYSVLDLLIVPKPFFLYPLSLFQPFLISPPQSIVLNMFLLPFPLLIVCPIISFYLSVCLTSSFFLCFTFICLFTLVRVGFGFTTSLRNKMVSSTVLGSDVQSILPESFFIFFPLCVNFLFSYCYTLILFLFFFKNISILI